MSSPARAADLLDALVETYWDQRRKVFRSTPRHRRTWRHPIASPLNYWWQAHALHVLVDAGDLERAAGLLRGVLRRNGGRITNDYYDDMSWMALALHHAALAGLDTSDLSAQLRDALRAGYDSERCVMRWRRGDLYVNVAATAPAAILAALGGDSSLARDLVAGLHGSFVEPSGEVIDGVHGNGSRNTARYPYNYGTVVGADLAMHSLNGEEFYRERAGGVVATALRRFAPDGLLIAEGSADAGLFPGILARYLGAYAAVTGDTAVRDVLERSAAEVAHAPPSKDLSTALSRVLIAQAAAA